jgi:hypothetical protein
VSAFTPTRVPTLTTAAFSDSSESAFRASATSRIARSRNSCGYFLGADTICILSGIQTLHQAGAVQLTVVENGKRLITPTFIVIVALGSTDLMFALDSIPAIYGLTEEPYLVFTANALALMGPPTALLPDRRVAPQARLPVDRAIGHPGLHRGQACTRGVARLPRGRLGSVRRRDPHLVLVDLHHRHPAFPTVASLIKSRYDEDSADATPSGQPAPADMPELEPVDAVDR